MTAPTTPARTPDPTPTPAPAPDLDLGRGRDGDRARFRDLLACEWLKLWSLRSLVWALGLSALGLVAINANGALADVNNWPTYPPELQAHFVPDGALGDAFTNNAGICLLLAAGCIGAATVAGEYSTGMIRTGFAAVPARRSLMAAKLLVVTSVMLAWGVLVATLSFWLSQAILSARDAGVPVTAPGALRTMVVSALLAPVCALVGMGLAVLIRHAATSMVAAVGLLLLLPNLLTDNHHWEADLDHATVFRAWQQLKDGTQHPLPGVDMGYRLWSDAGAWTDYALWSALPVLLVLLVIRRRDL